MNIEPEGHKLIVLPDPISEKTAGGIYRPDVVKDQEQRAEIKGSVVAIGPEVIIAFNDGPLKVGDRIVFARYGGFEMNDGDVKYRIINDEDVLARCSKE
jgi:chaperonin GroES